MWMALIMRRVKVTVTRTLPFPVSMWNLSSKLIIIVRAELVEMTSQELKSEYFETFMSCWLQLWVMMNILLLFRLFLEIKSQLCMIGLLKFSKLSEMMLVILKVPLSSFVVKIRIPSRIWDIQLIDEVVELHGKEILLSVSQLIHVCTWTMYTQEEGEGCNCDYCFMLIDWN